MKELKKTNKRIAFFTTIPLEFGGGAELLTIYTAGSLAAKKGFEVTIYAYKEKPTKGLLNRIKYDKAVLGTSNRIPLEAIKLMLGKAMYKKTTSLSLINKLEDQDRIIIRSDIPSLLPIFFICMRKPSLRKKILIQFHTPIKYVNNVSLKGRFHNLIYPSLLYKLFIRMISNKYQILNREDKKVLKRATLIKTPADKIFFTPQIANTTFKKKKTVIISGRLSFQKGIDMLPDLFKELTRKKLMDNFRFIITGSGEMEDIVKSLTKKYKNVKYMGHIAHNDMPSILDKGNIFLMLSRYEGSPLSLAEAFARGLIVLAFNIPGIASRKTKDILIASEPFDIKGIVKKLKLLSSMQKQEFLSKASQSRKLAESEYRMESYIKKLEGLININ